MMSASAALAFSLLLFFFFSSFVYSQVPPSISFFRDDDGYYIGNPPNPYMVTVPVDYEITRIVGTDYYTITRNGWYLSAQPGGSGFNQDGPNPAYNQFKFEYIDPTHFYIFSQYLFEYNGYGWLCSQRSLHYSPYYCNGPVAWTLAPINAEYLGCYRDSATRDLPAFPMFIPSPTSGRMTIEFCRVRCGVAGYQYAGLQYSDQCYCGDSFGGQGPASNCDNPCTGNSTQICGGYYANSVYSSIKPINIGCYNDAADRDLPYLLFTGPITTIEECVGGCRARGFAYAGLQYTEQCWCGPTYGKHGVTTGCTMTCLGDSSTYCGNAWKNNVYGYE